MKIEFSSFKSKKKKIKIFFQFINSLTLRRVFSMKEKSSFPLLCVPLINDVINKHQNCYIIFIILIIIKYYDQSSNI